MGGTMNDNILFNSNNLDVIYHRRLMLLRTAKPCFPAI